MLLNVSYNDKEVSRKIDAALGKTFPLLQRFKMCGIGSPKLILTETSIQISRLMNLDNNRNVCNIEMRPKGIIVGFRSKLDSYALIIPYNKLLLYKEKAEEYVISIEDYFVKFDADAEDIGVHSFIKKLIEAKNNATPQGMEDP